MKYPRAEIMMLIVVALFTMAMLARISSPAPDISWEARP